MTALTPALLLALALLAALSLALLQLHAATRADARADLAEASAARAIASSYLEDLTTQDTQPLVASASERLLTPPESV